PKSVFGALSADTEACPPLSLMYFTNLSICKRSSSDCLYINRAMPSNPLPSAQEAMDKYTCEDSASIRTCSFNAFSSFSDNISLQFYLKLRINGSLYQPLT